MEHMIDNKVGNGIQVIGSIRSEVRGISVGRVGDVIGWSDVLGVGSEHDSALSLGASPRAQSKR